MSTVSVILPTYNERHTITESVYTALEALGDGAECIVVDDDSPDGTAQAVRDRFGHREDVRLIVRTGESGLSSAVLRGFDAADGDVLAVMDADLQHPPHTVADLVAAVDEGADLAVGSRHADGGGVSGDWPLHRRLISWGASGLAWGAVPQARKLTDPMSGMFAIRAELVEPVRERLRPRGYKILLELLARTPAEDIREVGYVFGQREFGESNLGPREYVRYVRHLARLSVPARTSRDVAVPTAAGVDE